MVAPVEKQRTPARLLLATRAISSIRATGESRSNALNPLHISMLLLKPVELQLAPLYGTTCDSAPSIYPFDADLM